MFFATVGVWRCAFDLKDYARSRAAGTASARRPLSLASLLQVHPPGLAAHALQMVDPWRWMATQAIIFLPTLIGSTRQYMMKGVPSFL